METTVPNLKETGIDRNVLIIENFNSYFLTTGRESTKKSK